MMQANRTPALPTGPMRRVLHRSNPVSRSGRILPLWSGHRGPGCGILDLHLLVVYGDLGKPLGPPSYEQCLMAGEGQSQPEPATGIGFPQVSRQRELNVAVVLVGEKIPFKWPMVRMKGASAIPPSQTDRPGSSSHGAGWYTPYPP